MVSVDIGVPISMIPSEVLEAVKPTCESPTIPTVTDAPVAASLQAELNEAIGGGAGDWIKTLVKPLAHLVGRQSCTQCEARRIATNAFAKLKVRYGNLEALRIMKELWTMSSDPEATLTKLKTYLED